MFCSLLHRSSHYALCLASLGLLHCSPGAGDKHDDMISGGQTGDVDQHGCATVDLREVDKEPYGLDGETPLGVAQEQIDTWTVGAEGSVSWFDVTTAEESSEPPSAVVVEVTALSAWYASAPSPGECPLQEALFVTATIEVEVDGLAYRGEALIELRPAGTVSGEETVLEGSGELPLVQLECVDCAQEPTLSFAGNFAGDGHTTVSLQRGTLTASLSVGD